MSAERAAALDRSCPQEDGVIPLLTPICVADDRDVEQALAAAAAELSMLRLRHRAALRQADEAEAQAAAASPPDGMTLDDEAVVLHRQLEQEWLEHLRVLDVGLDRVRADATALIDAARADAVEVLRAASGDLDVAAATYSGFPAPGPSEAPVEAAAPTGVVAVPPPPASPAVDEQPAPPLVTRLLQRQVGLPLIEVAILLLLLFALVR